LFDMDVLYMFAIPVRWGEDVIPDEDLLDLRRAVTPTCEAYEAIVKLMERRGCSTLWLTKPKTRPTYVAAQEFLAGEKPFHSCVPPNFREEVERLSNASRGDVLVLKPDGAAYVKSMKKGEEGILYSFFVQSVQHLNKSSRVLFALAGRRSQRGLGVFQSSELKQCCVDHLFFHLQKKPGGGDLELKVFIGGHSEHLALPSLQTLKRWFGVSL